MAFGHNIENVFFLSLGLYLSHGSSDVDEIRWPGAHFGSKNGHVSKSQHFQNL